MLQRTFFLITVSPLSVLNIAPAARSQPWPESDREDAAANSSMLPRSLRESAASAHRFITSPRSRDHPQEVSSALALKKLGNDIVYAIGGRAVHPITTCIGGFSRAPLVASMADIRQQLHKALPEALRLARLTGNLDTHGAGVRSLCCLRYPLRPAANPGVALSSRTPYTPKPSAIQAGFV